MPTPSFTDMSHRTRARPEAISDIQALRKVRRNSLECRAAVANAALHDKEAELFYVVDGSATLVTGGKLKEEKRTNPDNSSGSGIEGGVTRHVAKGDFIMVPEGTPHWFSTIDGTIVLMSLHLPRAK
jgi:mannose-6-phosphate isomerase-like protein (cupin superfamily)